MTSVIRARRRAEEFAAAVDGSTTAVHPEVQALLDVVSTLRAQADPDARPRADFAADLRARLMAEAADELAPSAPLVLPIRRKGPRERRLVAAATAAILVGGSAGMAAAAQGALPGDPLYPVKRGIERAEAGLSVSQAGKGRDLLRQAGDRLTETSRLLDSGGTSTVQVPGTLANFTAQAQQGAALLMAAYRDNGDAATISAIRSFTGTGIASLKEMARTAPAEAQPDLAAAAVALSDIDRQAIEICSRCSDLPAVEVPSMFLTASEAQRALAEIGGQPPLDNSHPVPLPGSLVGPTGISTGGAGPVQQGSGGTGPAPTTDPTTIPAPPSPALPGDGPVSEGKKKLDDTLQGVTDGLQGAVETLLPDTDVNLLP